MPSEERTEKRSFKNLLAKASPDFDQVLQSALKLIDQLEESQLRALVDVSLSALEDPHAIDESKLSGELHLSEPDALNVAMAGTILSAAIEVKETPNEIVDMLREKLSLDRSQTSGATKLMVEFQKRASEVSQASAKRDLSTELLPSFQHLWSTVDIRLKFANGNVSMFVPVVVAQIKTDREAFQGRFWFQMSKAQLKRLISEAQKILGEIEAAETWAREHLRE